MFVFAGYTDNSDLIDSSARVAELSRLVGELPPANYALLRAFTAHLILIVKNSAVNKMTLRNIGIVFSPTLGIPAGIFYEMVSRFGAIFDDEGVDELPLDDALITGVAPSTESPTMLSPSSSGALEPSDPAMANKNKRNSVLYHAGGTDAMLGLGGRALDPAAEDSTSELSIDDLESEPMSAQSSDNLSLAAPRAGTPGTSPGTSVNDGTARGSRRGEMYSGTHSDDIEALQTRNGRSNGAAM